MSDSEERFEAFMTHLPAGAWIVDGAGRLLFVNPRFCELVRLGPADMLGKSSLEFYPAELARQHQANDAAVRAAGRPLETQEPYLLEDGTVGQLIVVKFPVIDPRPDRSTGGLVGGVAIDVTDRVRAEAALRVSEEQFRSAFRDSGIGMALVSTGGRFLRVNRSLCELLGYAEADLLATDFQALTHPDDLGRDLGQLGALLAGELGTYTLEKRYVRADGRTVWATLTVSLVRGADGLPAHFVSQIQDITERKRVEAELLRTLRERETLIKEVHHRVKNNLAVITGLLSMQARRSEDAGVRGSLRESQNRVRSMAIVHEMLYQGGDLAGIDLAEYARQLGALLQASYAPPGGPVALSLTIPPLVIDMDRAIPIGLLINELVSNAFKHAFPDGRRGTVGVAVFRGDTEATLAVSDDGVGLPPGVDPAGTRTLGMRLVHSLAEQLGGEADISTGGGTTVAVTFPLAADSEGGKRD